MASCPARPKPYVPTVDPFLKYMHKRPFKFEKNFDEPFAKTQYNQCIGSGLPSSSYNVSNRKPCPFCWSMLLPCLAALFMLGVSIYRFSSMPTDRSHLALTIPLFMTIGEPIVSKALAICTATPRLDSTTFGCGWLSWSLNALIPTLSRTRELLPKPDFASRVMNLKNGIVTENQSFVLSRILRDLELSYPPQAHGLTIEILDTESPKPAQTFMQSMATNILTMAIGLTQLYMATFAYVAKGEEAPLLLYCTALFTMEAIANMPAWKHHKFPTAHEYGNKPSSYALMRGNGHRQVYIICNVAEEALDLQVMARTSPSQYDYRITGEDLVVLMSFVCFLMIALLSTFMSAFSAACMLVILIFGTAGNVITATLPREPWMHGLALSFRKVIYHDFDSLSALQGVEKMFPGFGAHLLKEFFPDGLNQDEQMQWDLQTKKGPNTPPCI